MPLFWRHGGVALRLDVGDQVRHRPLHDAGALHHLGQEHLPGAEEIADDVHPRHQRPFDHVDRVLGEQPRLLGVFHHVVRDPFHQGVRQPLVHRRAAPGKVDHLRRGLAAHRVGDGQQPVGGVGSAIEHEVLHPLEQLGRECRSRSGSCPAFTIPMSMPASMAW